MNGSPRMKQSIYNAILPEPALLSDHLEDLGGSDVVLHPYPDGGDPAVVFLLRFSKLAALRLLERHDRVVAGSVAEVSGILIYRILIGETVLLVRDPFVMEVPRHCTPDKEYESGHGGHDRVLYGMPLLLATVLILLLLMVYRTRYLPLRAVVDQDRSLPGCLQTREYLLKAFIGGLRHGSRLLQRVHEYAVKAVEPLVALRLGHVEELRDKFLYGVLLEVEEYEVQPFRDTRKRAILLNRVRTRSGTFLTVKHMPPEIFVMGFREVRQVRVEGLDTHSCQSAEPRRVGSCCCVTHDNITDFSSFALMRVIKKI